MKCIRFLSLIMIILIFSGCSNMDISRSKDVETTIDKEVEELHKNQPLFDKTKDEFDAAVMQVNGIESVKVQKDTIRKYKFNNASIQIDVFFNVIYTDKISYLIFTMPSKQSTSEDYAEKIVSVSSILIPEINNGSIMESMAEKGNRNFGTYSVQTEFVSTDLIITLTPNS